MLLANAPLGERIMRGRGLEFADLLEALGEAVTIRDTSHKLVYANPAALRHLGFGTLQELQQRPLIEIMDEYLVHDAEGRPLSMSDVPSVKLLQGRQAEPLLMHSVNRQTGEARWELLKTAALRDSSGQLLGAVTVIEDLTAVKNAETHTRLLAESGRILASSLDFQQTLENVAQVAVPALADWCVVDLVDGRLERQQVVVAHRDPHGDQMAASLCGFGLQDLVAETTLGRVLRTGSSELFFDVDEDHLASVARSPENLRMMLELEIRSAVVVPMTVPDRTIGVMTFLTSSSRRRLTPDALPLAEQLARRAAVAVENSRLHTALARVSRTLQQSLLPSELPDVPGWEIASLYRPAGAEPRIEVGGDFFEVFNTGPASLALIGDVTGHGVAAAALTAVMRQGARFASRVEPAPAAILRQLDEELRQRPEAELCTALCARLHERRLVFSSAGHPPALIVDAGGGVIEVPEPGPLLGAFADAHWRQDTVEIGPDQLALLYTDGVTEAPGRQERFGPARLRQLLVAHAGCSPQELLDGLDAALLEFRVGAGGDDVAALALRPRP